MSLFLLCSCGSGPQHCPLRLCRVWGLDKCGKFLKTLWNLRVLTTEIGFFPSAVSWAQRHITQWNTVGMWTWGQWTIEVGWGLKEPGGEGGWNLQTHLFCSTGYWSKRWFTKVQVRDRPRRIRVVVDMDRGCVEFYEHPSTKYQYMDFITTLYDTQRTVKPTVSVPPVNYWLLWLTVCHRQMVHM